MSMQGPTNVVYSATNPYTGGLEGLQPFIDQIILIIDTKGQFEHVKELMQRVFGGEDIMDLMPSEVEVAAVVGGDNPTPASGCSLANRTFYDPQADEGDMTPHHHLWHEFVIGLCAMVVCPITGESWGSEKHKSKHSDQSPRAVLANIKSKVKTLVTEMTDSTAGQVVSIVPKGMEHLIVAKLREAFIGDSEDARKELEAKHKDMNPWANRPVYDVTDKTNIEALFTNYAAQTTDLNKRVAAWRLELERKEPSAERTRLLDELQIVGDNANGDNLTYAKTTDAVLLANIKEKVVDKIPRYQDVWKSLMMLKSIGQLEDLTLEIVKNAILATYRTEVKGKVEEPIPVQAIQGENSCAHCGATDHKEWSPWCPQLQARSANLGLFPGQQSAEGGYNQNKGVTWKANDSEKPCFFHFSKRGKEFPNCKKGDACNFSHTEVPWWSERTDP